MPTDRLSATFAALADPTRRAILARLEAAAAQARAQVRAQTRAHRLQTTMRTR